MKLRALRGAITVDRDTPEEVVKATAELLREMLERNDIESDQIVSIIFTATGDISSEFPAAASREVGLSHIPLLCTRELDVEGAVPRVIRVLMHLYTDEDYDTLRHVYLGDAKALRTDLRQ